MELPKARIYGQAETNTSTLTARRGIVKGIGRQFTDDDGTFHPLGVTLFWAPIGFRSERERLVQNLKFIKEQGADFVRWLAEVDWPNREINPAWPDYDDVIRGTIDLCYEHGLRSEITVIGGNRNINQLALAQRISVLVQGREHKILFLEAANEYFARNISDATIRAMASTLGMVGVLSAPSSPVGGDVETVTRLMNASLARVATGHLARNDGDVTAGVSWREVRQAWDWRDFPFLCCHNEPKGPQSSVASQDDPMVLAMMRAVGILCGIDAYVLHVGAGVTGLVDPAHNRPANIFETGKIQEIFNAQRVVSAVLPQTLPNWQKYNGHWPGHPFPPDAVWTDAGNDHGVVRAYGARSGSSFVVLPHGIKRYFDVVVPDACTVRLINPLNGDMVRGLSLKQGEQVRVDGPEQGGLPAYIVLGETK